METTGMRLPCVSLFAAILNLVLSSLAAQGQMMPISAQRPLCASQYTLANYACSRLPFIPSPPAPVTPPPAPAPDDDGRHNHSHGHGHGHHHHRHRVRSESLAEAECCRWLKQMDSECICDLLVHLPPLLVRPSHDFTLLVHDSCTVTFTCPTTFILS